MAAPDPTDLDRDLAAFFAQGLAAPPDDASFNALALRVFAFQFEALAPYRAFCQRRGALPARLRHWTEIPAVPVQAFKDLRLQCDEAGAGSGEAGANAGAARVFRTSGTTAGQRPGEHYMTPAALALYDASLLPTFHAFVLPDVPAGADGAAGARSKLVPHVLGPPPGGAPHSSLWHMVEVAGAALFERPPACWMGAVGGPAEASLDADGLMAALAADAAAGRAACLFATDLALDRFLAAAEARGWRVALPAGSRVMHTGGAKGRRHEIDVAELYARVAAVLGVPASWMVNEYGMTEAASQFYDDSIRRAVAGAAVAGTAVAGTEPGGPALPRLKFGPPWVRTLVVDVHTLEPLAPGRPGLLRIVDLANRGSVIALLTEDRAIAEPAPAPAPAQVPAPSGAPGGAAAQGAASTAVDAAMAPHRPQSHPFRLLGRARGSEPRGCSLEAEVPVP